MGLEDRPTPHIGEIWRHFKGEEYLIWDFWTARAPYKEGQKLEIYVDGPDGIGRLKTRCQSNIEMDETVILYRGLDDKVWPRSLANFMEVLSDPERGQYCRFERVN